jgi:23S rRNA (uracil1939-C5)-methyltransferase/tRNA (uracil-5-)-methyltransferase
MMNNSPKGFTPHPYPYHHLIDLEIESLTNLGLGLGRDNGWVVQVPYVLPGEKVQARIYRNHKNYSSADCISVHKASPNRVKPLCDLFGECGGCQYQHMEYATQLEWKQKQVEDSFARIGGIEFAVNRPIPSPQKYGYRSKLTPHFEKPHPSHSFKVGFLKQGTRRTLIDVDQCPIATPAINEAMPLAKQHLHDKKQGLKKGGTLLLRDTNQSISTDSNEFVQERVGNLTFQFRAGEFFQNNPFILPELVNYVIQQSQPQKSSFLIDAYCGSGLFGISAASYFKKVIGIEISREGFLGAQANAELNRISNTEFILGDASSIFDAIDSSFRPCTLLVDPPRKGCDQNFLSQALAFSPNHIVYISCDPATQARDAKILVDGGYSILDIQPFDLFPQTRHIESVMTLRKES